ARATDCPPHAEPSPPHPGPIPTVPNYFEAGLRSRSDPGVAFGPAPDKNGHFSWDNRSRLYYSDLATNLNDTEIGGGLNTNTAIADSHIDNVTPAPVAHHTNCSHPALTPHPPSRPPTS